VVANPDEVADPTNVPVIIPLLIVTPEIAVAEATYKLPPIPTPPATVNAPEDDEILVDGLEILRVPPINAFPVIPTPP
jgi:hypothetical protein